ncbi:MAG: 30S ribosomal protein S16 [Candidatus Roizmanbacteria bacterium]|nr:30S ribosomal protein S16 [Candidatus Roizmanbacteria bacterium]
MSVKIRLMRIGKRHDPKYRIIVIDERKKRNSHYIEQIGFYDPMKDPAELTFDKEKLAEWTKKGAQMSEGLRKLI